MENARQVTLTDFASAMAADGRTRQMVNQRVVMLTAIARVAGKDPVELTELDAQVYIETRGLKPASVQQVRSHVRNWRRFQSTGLASHRKGVMTIASLAEYRQWLQDGRYTSTRVRGAKRMTPQSSLCYGHHVAQVSVSSGVHPTRLTERHVRAWLALKSDTKEAYRNRTMRALRYYAEFAECEDPTENIRRYEEPLEEPKPKPAEPGCVGALLNHRDPEVIAMTILGAAGGLRRSEISKVKGTDFTRRNARWRLRIKGKGGKVRSVVIADSSIARMAPVFIPGHTKGRLFPSVSADQDKGGEQVGDRLTAAALESGYELTAHQLRHYAATTTYERMRDVVAVQHMLGHYSLDTTMRYILAWGDEQQFNVADELGDELNRLAS